MQSHKFRHQVLILAAFLGLFVGTISTVGAAPDTVPAKALGPTMMASPHAKFQVSTNGDHTRVTVSRGSVYVKTDQRPVEVYTADGVVAVESGELVVTASPNQVRVQVTAGQASLNSPYIISGQEERLPPFKVAAGETAEGRIAGPEEQAALEGLGLGE